MKKQESAVPIGAEGEKFIKGAYFLKISMKFYYFANFNGLWMPGHSGTPPPKYGRSLWPIVR